jgi:hypothetical protein
MKTINQIQRPTAVLLAANLALVAIIAVVWLTPAKPSSDVSAEALRSIDSLVPDVAANDPDLPAIADLSAMFERPLFFSDRRMPPVPEPVSVVEAPKPLRLKLEGVAIVADSRVAVVRDMENNRLLQLEEGMSHESWTLESVTAARAQFSRGQETSELWLSSADPGRSR